MRHSELLEWLRTPDPERLNSLWTQADDVRRANVGDAVFLRGLVEVSNHCRRNCTYCGIRSDNGSIERYRMTADEVLDCARKAVELGYGTVVLQAGEDPALSRVWVRDLIRRIKGETSLAITLSLGERDEDELTAWRAAGADRYLLRFETSNRALFERIHPPRNSQPVDRLAQLKTLRALGYEVGSGVMVGIPGQTYDDLARDIAQFAELDLDMIGVGPFVPHPDTPAVNHPPAPPDEQVPNTVEMTCRVVALARLVCPRTNIPSTTALATIDRTQGRELGLQRGANIVMPNLTPPEYRCRYEIYPGKGVTPARPEVIHEELVARVRAIGRTVGVGRGSSPRYRERTQTASTTREGVE